MKKHLKTYEQYCCVLDRNIVLEETVYHDGKKALTCTNLAVCRQCRNNTLKDKLMTK